MLARKIDTRELAEMLKCKSHTPIRALCVQGHYLGLRPVKLPNGRLLWDREAAELLINGGAAK